MARLLQNIEAHIVYSMIGKDLMDKGIVFTTIHDAFIVPEHMLNCVHKDVEKLLNEFELHPFDKKFQVSTKIYK